MGSDSSRCIVDCKMIDNFHKRNIVFTSAMFTLYDTAEHYEEFFENPNVVIKSIKDSGMCDPIDAEWAEENYVSSSFRKYHYKVTCYLIKEERKGVITNINNIDFTISYKNFLNFLKDNSLWD